MGKDACKQTGRKNELRLSPKSLKLKKQHLYHSEWILQSSLPRSKSVSFQMQRWGISSVFNAAVQERHREGPAALNPSSAAVLRSVPSSPRCNISALELISVPVQPRLETFLRPRAAPSEPLGCWVGCSQLSVRQSHALLHLRTPDTLTQNHTAHSTHSVACGQLLVCHLIHCCCFLIVLR